MKISPLQKTFFETRSVNKHTAIGVAQTLIAPWIVYGITWYYGAHWRPRGSRLTHAEPQFADQASTTAAIIAAVAFLFFAYVTVSDRRKHKAYLAERSAAQADEGATDL